jgi:hypothetical protein
VLPRARKTSNATATRETPNQLAVRTVLDVRLHGGLDQLHGDLHGHDHALVDVVQNQSACQKHKSGGGNRAMTKQQCAPFLDSLFSFSARSKSPALKCTLQSTTLCERCLSKT